MKAILVFLAVVLAGVLVAAQAPQSANQQQPQGGQAPAPSATAPASGQPKASAGAHQPQAKSKEEYDAFMAAQVLTDPQKLETAADDFAKKFPSSEVIAYLYVRDMSLFQQANDADKVIEVGKKAIAIDPTNPVPLVDVASALAESTHDSDLDREERLAEAGKYAKEAIANVDTGLQVPPNTPPEKVAAVKANILGMAYDTIAVVDMNRKDYASAEQNLQKAIESSKGQPEPVEYLRLSVAQDNLKKYAEALDSANKAVQYSPEGSAVQNLAKQQQSRMQKLAAANGGGAAAPSASPGTAPVSTAPVNNTTQPNAPPQPH